MYVFPVLRWLKMFSQTWEGDVTMVLPSSYMQLKKSVTNPSNKDLLDACKQVAVFLAPIACMAGCNCGWLHHKSPMQAVRGLADQPGRLSTVWLAGVWFTGDYSHGAGDYHGMSDWGFHSTLSSCDCILKWALAPLRRHAVLMGHCMCRARE